MDKLNEVLSREYYMNTLSEWLLAALYILLGVVLARVIYFVINKFLKRKAAKSKSRFDDILVDMFEEPFVFSMAVYGIYLGLETLDKAEKMAMFLSHAFHALITIIVTWFLVRFLKAIVSEYVRPRVEESETDFDDQLLPVLERSITILIWMIGILVALNNAGYDVGAIIAGLGIGGLAFALAAKDFIENIFGGVSIFTDKPFVVNQRIKVDGYDGYIESIGLRRTRLRTLDKTLVTLPNAKFIHENIENISEEPAKKIRTTLGLTYDTSSERIEEAIDILKQIITDNRDIVTEETIATLHSFGDFSLNINFIFHLRKDSDYFETIGKINLEILKRFNLAGLEFAFPTQTIHAHIESKR